MNKKIQDLQKQIAEEQKKINNCSHEFGKPFYNPETTKEPYGYVMEAQGSDVWGRAEGYRDVTKDRWTRICNKCGHEDHTYQQEPIVTGHKPKFK